MAGPVVGYVLKRFPRLSETFVLRELLELERQGIDVRVFALGRPDEPTVHADYQRLRAPVVYADQLEDVLGQAWPADLASGADSKSLRMARRLARHVRAAGVTHLHAHFATAAAEVASLIGRALDVPFSFTAHAKDIFHQDVSVEGLRLLLRDAAFAVTVSDYNVRYLSHVAGADATPVHRIYNGVDVLAAPQLAPREATPPRVLAVGRLVEKKGFDVLVDAIALLHERHVAVPTTLVGTGRCEEALRARIHERGVSSLVQMTGALPQHEVTALMQSHTLLAVPCRVSGDGDRDGLPTVIIEAMALGLPVVSTPVTGIPEIVRHGRTGWLVPEDDAEALASALAALLPDTALRTRLRESARTLVECEFDTRVNGQALAALFTASAAAPVMAGAAFGAGAR